MRVIQRRAKDRIMFDSFLIRDFFFAAILIVAFKFKSVFRFCGCYYSSVYVVNIDFDSILHATDILK